jgi:hypothetical protein
VQVEQVFDIEKNSNELVSLRIHGDETISGHLMLTFLSNMVFHLLQKDVLLNIHKKGNINTEGCFQLLRNQKCKVYDGVVIPQEPINNMCDIYDLLKIQSPVSIPYK